MHGKNVAQAQCFAVRGLRNALEGSNVVMGFQKYSRIIRRAQGGSARALLEDPGAPKGLFFADSCSGFAVFKKARISRIFEAHLFFGF